MIVQDRFMQVHAFDLTATKGEDDAET